KQYPVKVYCIDNAFINFVNPRFSENTGRLMENVVAVELFRRMENNQHLEIYYFKDYQQKEVDFVVKEGWEVKQLIQVTYAPSINEIEKREIKALLKASELLKCNNLLVITWDLEEEEKVERNRIKYIPLWKWLIEGMESKE
ncbi:ATP-binding protein, partial [bacterium]|nr:ATP-binding protein [bacterium]